MVASDKNCRVLVVDDDESLRELMTVLPAADPCLVIRTVNTAVGLAEQIREWKPDVILLDISMPDVRGDAALARLRQLGFRERIVVYSGLMSIDGSSDPIARWAMKLGADDFIAKPFDLVHLIDTLKRNCE